MKHIKQLLFCAFAFGLTAALAFMMIQNQESTKAYNYGFRAGNIMSDSVMRDYTSMSLYDIQSFLKSKNACNDTRTYIADWYPQVYYHIENGHFVCMADESFNGKSAAQIIYEASQYYHINPKVLIVLLEKEQGLVTDTFPHSGQYRAATGFGCPDTAACDSRYYGLENQIHNAAALFDTVLNGGWTNYPVGWNYIQYNPDPNCGGSWVNIENRATSALYRYTPYQPSQAALDAGYGVVTCGAYGNRNFYSYYTDWFGDTRGSRWERMLAPRIMTVKEGTRKVFPDSSAIDDYYLEPGRSIQFASKTLLYKDGELATCLRTKADTVNGINRCVPMSELSEYTPVYNDIGQKTYYSKQFTCKIHIQSNDADCGQAMSANTIKTASHSMVVNQKEYYILDEDYQKNDYVVLPERFQAFDAYEKITPTFFRTTSLTYKYLPISNLKVQTLISDMVISFSSKLTINGVDYYITTVDTASGTFRIVPATTLSDDLFGEFLAPRNLVVATDTSSYSPLTDTYCENLSRGEVYYFTEKAYLNHKGEWYYRTKDDVDSGAGCAIPSSALREVR